MMKRNEALGLWNIGEDRFHTRLSSVEAKRIIKEAYRTGLTTFDSAYSYLDADSILYSAIKELGIQREEWRIIEKIMPSPTLERKAEAALKRLHTSFLDILLIHWPAEETILYSSLKTLEKLREDGKAGEIGVSNFPLPLLKKVSRDFPVTYHERPLSLLWNKDYEEEKKLDIRTLAYAPFGFGSLEKNRTKLSPLFFSSSEATGKLREELKRISERKGCTVYSTALSWVYERKPYMIIRGASKPSQIDIPLVELNEEEDTLLSNLSRIITAETESDNIFNHKWNKDEET